MSEQAAIREVNELLRELIENATERLDPVHEVNSRMLADATGIGITSAYRQLMKLEREGKLKSRWVRGKDGKREKAWRKVGA